MLGNTYYSIIPCLQQAGIIPLFHHPSIIPSLQQAGILFSFYSSIS
jgi:hypothetical protein